MRSLTAVLLLVAAAGWVRAAPLPPPEPGTGKLQGDVRLVPRPGVKNPRPGDSGYENRALRDVELVDYSRPGFVVVYLDRGPAPADSVQLTLRESRWRRRIEPGQAAVGSGGTVSLKNATAESHTISCPALGVIRRIGPGEVIELAIREPGPLQVHVLDESLTATVFAAPGPYTVVSKRGRFSLGDLPPGAATLRAWHPRFPAAALPVEITADGVEKLTLEIGIRGPDAMED